MALIDNLISWYDLEESSGTRSDAHSTNDLTDVNTVQSATGKVGDCAAFLKANSEKLTHIDNAALSFGDDPFTISCWIKIDNTDNHYPLVAKWDWGVDENNEYMLVFQTDLQWKVSPDGVSIVSAVGGSISVDTWYHVVAWHDPIVNEIAIAIDDGTPVQASHSTGVFDGVHDFELGASNSQYADAQVDSLGIWDRVLTAQERTDLYNSGSGVAYADISETDPTAVLNLPLADTVWETQEDVLCRVTVTPEGKTTSSVQMKIDRGAGYVDLFALRDDGVAPDDTADDDVWNEDGVLDA